MIKTVRCRQVQEFLRFALLVELSTDNRNRTASEIRSLVTKAGGSIGSAGE